MHVIHLQTAVPYGQLSKTLKKTLHEMHIQWVSSARKAPITLKISPEQINHDIAGIASTTNIRQYRLNYQVRFQITQGHPRKQTKWQTITSQRTVTINANQRLGSNAEAHTLLQEIRLETAQKIINHLAAAAHKMSH